MRRRFAVCVETGLLLVAFRVASGQSPTRRVVTAAQIAAAGWHRLGDVAAALMPGRMASVDGFNVALTAGRLPFAGLSAMGSPSWVVRVDGQRMPMAIDGMWILDELPVAMVQVDSIVIDEGVSIVDGQASALGTLDVFTRRPHRGPGVVADYQHGDESGDPGPYRYTARATSNVEKLGPFTSGALSYGAADWALDVAARYSSLNITDTNISRRFPTTFGGLQQDVNASGGSGVLTTRLFGGQQITIGGRGRFTGLLWIPAKRHEESVRLIATQGGSSGTVNVGIPLRFGVSVTSLETRELKSPLPLTVDGGLTSNQGFAEALLPDSSTAVGVGFDWADASGEHSAPPAHSRSATRAWVDLFRRSPLHRITASIAAGDGVAFSLTGWKEFGLGRYHARLSAASVQRLPEADGAGYARPWEPQTFFGISDSAIVSIPRGRFNEGRVDFTDTTLARMIPSVGFRVFETSDWRLDPRVGSGDGRMMTGTVSAGVETKPESPISGSIRAEVAAIPQAPADLRAAMDATPAVSLRADLSKVVMTDLRLSVSGAATSARSWPSEGISGEMTDLPALRRIDVSANKRLWRDRINAQLVIRNLLAADERYHPVGASWNFRTHLAVTVELPPYPLR